MKTARLPRGEWRYNPEDQLGPAGGFGVVYRGHSKEHGRIAVKRLHLTAREAAHRELRVADELSGRQLSHVIPILDAGLDAESDAYFVVMPEAERSLADELDQAGTLGPFEAAAVLRQIALGLLEVPALVHRDLKPANILLHEAKWKVADFGIARFVEESTSVRTLKGCLSPPYAAPEQWQLDHATQATDVYSLGCIAYALLTGSPPFSGPSPEEFKQQHLSTAPPSLPDANPSLLRSVVALALRKLPETRPRLERVRDLLERAVAQGSATESPGSRALAAMGAAHAAQQLEEQSTAGKRAEEERRRRALAQTGREVLEELISNLLDRVQEEAPSAIRRGELLSQSHLGQFGIGRGASVQLHSGGLEVHYDRSEYLSHLRGLTGSVKDAVSGAVIIVAQRDPKYEWAASLWYGRSSELAEYRWHEMSYFHSPLLQTRSHSYEPFALSADQLGHTDDRGLSGIQIAWGPVVIDDEDRLDFFDRWMSLLARASSGSLSAPRNFPYSRDAFFA